MLWRGDDIVDPETDGTEQHADDYHNGRSGPKEPRNVETYGCFLLIMPI